MDKLPTTSFYLCLILIIIEVFVVTTSQPIQKSFQNDFCQLDLYKGNSMNSKMNFASFRNDDSYRIKHHHPKSYRITSSPDMTCCWKIVKKFNKKRKVIKTLKNNGQTSLFNQLKGVKPPFFVKKCHKKN